MAPTKLPPVLEQQRHQQSKELRPSPPPESPGNSRQSKDCGCVVIGRILDPAPALKENGGNRDLRMMEEEEEEGEKEEEEKQEEEGEEVR